MTKRRSQHKLTAASQQLPLFLFKRFMEGAYILVLSMSIYVFLSLATYSPSDPNWTHVSLDSDDVLNAGGRVGAYLADILYWLFGYFAYAVPISVAYLAGAFLQDSKRLMFNKPVFFMRTSGFVFFMLGTCALLGLNVRLTGPDGLPGAGGMLGAFIADGFDGALSTQGASLLLSAVILVGVTWLTGFSWIQAIEHLGEAFAGLFEPCKWLMQRLNHFIERISVYIGKTILTQLQRTLRAIMQLTQHMTKQLRKTVRTTLSNLRKPAPLPLVSVAEDAKIKRRVPPAVYDKTTAPAAVAASTTSTAPAPTARRIAPAPFSTAHTVSTQTSLISTTVSGLPALSLLDAAEDAAGSSGYSPQVLEQLSRDLEQHLLDFGIHVEVVAVHPGPVITRFELQLAAGVKVSRLSALSKDLARALSVVSVRVVEIIPGKTVVGLELPNAHRDMVRLSRVFSSDVYQQAHSLLTLALGVDIAGYPMVVDLAKMPHLLVAGTTGSGKSVGINAMILSLLYRATPEQVRLIMIDPKMLELSVYEGIPHLLTPVVTDMKEAASALRWCVAEMERRYRLMAALGVRNLAGYNTQVSEALAQGVPLRDPLWKEHGDEAEAILQTLPYVVVVIDELADMMMVVGKKVEQLIARIAQKARAAGIHLILATQRPSVDVLTGLIKSNIPTRISFQVYSKIDSRTILDQQGAEQLLGYGDMLFLSPGSGAPLRVHGAFVSDAEVHRVAEDWRKRGTPVYIDDVTSVPDEDAVEEGGGDEADPLYDEVVAFVVSTQKGSISAIQRRFKVGYNRAARLVDTLEEVGVLGPLEGGSRSVLVSDA